MRASLVRPAAFSWTAAFGRPSCSAMATVPSAARHASTAVSSASRNWACAKCRRSQWASRNTASNVRLASTTASPASANPKTGPRPSRSHVPPQSSNSHGQGSSQGSQGSKGTRGRQAIILTASGGAATAAVLAFTDDIKASYETAERTGRVAAALVLCINDYRTTLNKREKVDDLREKDVLLKACHKRCADRTYEVLEKNGGIFIKLGQHLSAMNYLLPLEWTTTFIPLQDQCPVSSFASIQQMYRDDTGTDLMDYFSEFAPEPIGAASLAQVHLATIRATGQQVAVKVQHPGLAQFAPLDMALTSFTFSTLKRFFPEYDLEWLSAEMSSSLPQELDFAREADNARRTQAYFAAHKPDLPLIVPHVIWARQRLLVMARESGHRLDDLAYLDAHAIDRDRVSAALAHVFNEMIFGDGAPLHCDPHGGNLSVRARPAAAGWKATLRAYLTPWRYTPNFDIILYDHGLYRDIPLNLRRSYAKMWLAVLDGDMPRMAQYAEEVAGVDAKSFPLFASAITGRDFSVLSSASILQPRTDVEKDSIGGQLQDGLLTDLVQLLGRVPRIILLILKTNDLTRSLDEGLHTKQGPVQSFLIMARYCLRSVLEEQVEAIQTTADGTPGSSLLWPRNAAKLLGAYWRYFHGQAKLELFDLWLRSRRLLGLQTNLGLGM